VTYTAGEVRGILRHYTKTNRMGSTAHLKSLDIQKHFPRQPQRVKQVLFLHGIMGLDSRTVADRLDMSKDSVLSLYRVGSAWLARDMANELDCDDTV